MTINPSTLADVPPAPPPAAATAPPPDTAAALGTGGAAVPRLTTTLLGLLTIAAATFALADLGAGLFLLSVLAGSGREALTEFLLQARFDPLLGVRIGAGEISLLYLGLTTATLATARLAGGGGWRRFVALDPVRPGRRRTAIVGAVTLLYAAALTLSFAYAQERRAASDGPTDVLLLLLLIGNYVILAPLAEEVFFRGWLYTGLRTRFGFGATFALTTVAFAAIHWDASHRRILLVLPLALALGWLRESCGSIKPTIVLHGCYNALIVGITLALS